MLPYVVFYHKWRKKTSDPIDFRLLEKIYRKEKLRDEKPERDTLQAKERA